MRAKISAKFRDDKIVSMGMAHVPEGRRVFAELSVYENLKLGAYTRKIKRDRGDIGTCIQELPASGGAKKPACRNIERWRTADACYGTRTDVKAKIILMDEPSMGLSPILVERFSILSGRFLRVEQRYCL